MEINDLIGKEVAFDSYEDHKPTIKGVVLPDPIIARDGILIYRIKPLEIYRERNSGKVLTEVFRTKNELTII